MSTRSLVGIENKNGSIDCIYIHNDGYIRGGVGECLIGNYVDRDKVRRLVNLGDLSSIGPCIGKKHDFNAYRSDICRSYGRDRRETNTKAVTVKSAEDFLKLNRDAEFCYYRQYRGEWMVSQKLNVSLGIGAGFAQKTAPFESVFSLLNKSKK